VFDPKFRRPLVFVESFAYTRCAYSLGTIHLLVLNKINCSENRWHPPQIERAKERICSGGPLRKRWSLLPDTGLYLDPSVCARNVRKHPLERTEEGSRLLRKLKLLKHTQESENVDIIYGKVVHFRSFQTKRTLMCNIQCWNILCVLISVFNQLDAQNCFTVSFISCLYMFRAHVLIIRRSKLYYTASGIVTPIGVWWYQRLCNAILTSWWWAHVLETCRGMK